MFRKLTIKLATHILSKRGIYLYHKDLVRYKCTDKQAIQVLDLALESLKEDLELAIKMEASILKLEKL